VVRQRTQLMNAIRGHLSEFGFVFPQGTSAFRQIRLVIDEDEDQSLPHAAKRTLQLLMEQLSACETQIAEFDKAIQRRARESADAKRLMSIPGIGAITATALAALAPAPSTFKKGRDFAAWVGLTPLERSSGGKQRFGRTSKMGESSLRRLLIVGASAVV